MTRKLYIVRHAEKMWNNGKKPKDVDGCQHDPPVKDFEKLTNTINKLKEEGVKFDVILTSPFLRCRQTTNYIVENTGQDSSKILSMKYIGEYLGNQRRSRIELQKETLNSYTRKDYELLTSETIPRLNLRIKLFFKYITSLPDESNVLVVTHGLVATKMFPDERKLEEGELEILYL